MVGEMQQDKWGLNGRILATDIYGITHWITNIIFSFYRGFIMGDI